MLLEKTSAPDFELPDQNTINHKLSDYRGQWVILYFYPEDDTPGCTTEACLFQDNLPNFDKLKIKVLGVSADSVGSHRKFAEKYNLNLTLLSDDKKEVIKSYGADGISVKRISYLVDPQGQIYKVYAKVKPETHAEEVLADLRAVGIE